jgi:hypothetical protein
LPPPEGGDVYINEKTRKVWYHTGSSWAEWSKVTEEARHPTAVDVFLVPGNKHFQWRDSGSFPAFTETSTSKWVERMLNFQDANPELYEECVTFCYRDPL